MTDSRNSRKVRTGVVTSVSGAKTIVVTITERKRHPKYGKMMTSSKKLHAHDEECTAGVGDTVRVTVRVKEGNRVRNQAFDGTIIAKKHGGINETITVRRISYGVGCEKVFPVHSPTIVSVETIRRGKVRRAKLYYLRDRVGKKAKVKERI